MNDPPSNVGPEWEHVSAEAKQLIVQMLQKSPKDRVTAAAALAHPWIANFRKTECDATPPHLIETLRKLRDFRAMNTMQKSVLAYIASQNSDKESEKVAREIFASLDKDGNGCISGEELAAGYMRVYHNLTQAKRDAVGVMKMVDLNRNGMVDYNGMLIPG